MGNQGAISFAKLEPDREQTATLQTALLQIMRVSAWAADPDANRSAGLHSDPGVIAN